MIIPKNTERSILNPKVTLVNKSPWDLFFSQKTQTILIQVMLFLFQWE